jgi:hypothetical protein
MVIIPPQVHIVLSPILRAGLVPIITVGELGIQGVVTGTHGIGVRTPRAAAVAAATVGLATDEHIPNGAMFIIGAKSIIFPAGNAPQNTRFVGRTFNVDGATPNVH